MSREIILRSASFRTWYLSKKECPCDYCTSLCLRHVPVDPSPGMLNQCNNLLEHAGNLLIVPETSCHQSLKVGIGQSFSSSKPAAKSAPSWQKLNCLERKMPRGRPQITFELQKKMQSQRWLQPLVQLACGSPAKVKRSPSQECQSTRPGEAGSRSSPSRAPLCWPKNLWNGTALDIPGTWGCCRPDVIEQC